MKDKALEGKKAAQLLENPIYLGAVESLREKYYKRIETSKGEAQGEREDAYYLLRALRSLEAEIKGVVDSGKAAEAAQGRQRVINRLNRLKQGD